MEASIHQESKEIEESEESKNSMDSKDHTKAVPKTTENLTV